MKKQSSSTEKNLLDEFTEYIESVYEPEADYESLSDELLQFEYERFLEMMAK